MAIGSLCNAIWAQDCSSRPLILPWCSSLHSLSPFCRADARVADAVLDGIADPTRQAGQVSPSAPIQHQLLIRCGEASPASLAFPPLASDTFFLGPGPPPPGFGASCFEAVSSRPSLPPSFLTDYLHWLRRRQQAPPSTAAGAPALFGSTLLMTRHSRLLAI